MAEVSVLRGAEDEVLSIYFSIFDSDEQKAEKFSGAFDQVLSDLENFPQLGIEFDGPFRRKLIPGFYEFGIFYTLEGERIFVCAVLSLRQSPERIRERLHRE